MNFVVSVVLGVAVEDEPRHAGQGSSHCAPHFKTFGQSLKGEDLPKGDRIVKRVEKKQGKFIHGDVAETLLRNYSDITFTETTLDRFATLIDPLNATIGA